MPRFFKIIILLNILLAPSYYLLGQSLTDSIHFVSPVDIPIKLAGNFGEIRGTHFHMGIDIKTQGVEGKNIYSIADGFVSRIKVSSGGYGNAIYITHPNGYVSVYGHLKRFAKDINSYVTDFQYKNKRFAVNIYPPKDKFQVRQGQKIGLSGNSGSSQGPHLHFEIRKQSNEHPVNPMLFNFDIEDNIKPSIYSLTVYPIDFSSHVDSLNEKLNLSVNKIGSGYKLKSDSPIPVFGNIGFGIESNDFLDGSHNKCGVFTIELMIDSNLIYSTEMSELDFAEQGYVKSHIDYEAKVENRKTIQKSYIDPNNKSSIYTFDFQNGIVNINDTLLHEVEYILTDVDNNSSYLRFNVKGAPLEEKDSIIIGQDYTQAMPFKIENTFIGENIELTIPANALFRDLFFKYSIEESPEGSFSRLHSIHDITVPIHKSYILKIIPDSIPDLDINKLVIAQVFVSEGKTSMSGYSTKIEGDYLVTSTTDFGNFAVFADTLPPEISPVNIYDGKVMTGKSNIKLWIKDDFTGISKYNGYIDDEWVLFRYDAKNKAIYYNFSDNKISRNKYHKLKIIVSDNVGNETEVKYSFYY